MLTSLHIDWDGDFISILVILRSQTYEIVKGGMDYTSEQTLTLLV